MCLTQLAWIDCDQLESDVEWLMTFGMSVGVVVLVVEFGVN